MMKNNSEGIRKVWKDNFSEESRLIFKIIQKHNYVAVDTEFPGFLINTPRYAPQDVRYRNLAYNVNNTKLIQVGLTFFDERGNTPYPGCAWQFHLSDFNPAHDLHSPKSIELLCCHGIDFNKNISDGIDSNTFAMLLKNLVACVRFQWVTFHGLYDLAYIAKVLSGSTLPSSIEDFLYMIGTQLHHVFDVKHIAKSYEGLMGGELGLERLATILKIERHGECHQAGSDSLLTAAVFAEMKRRFKFDENVVEGCLYSIDSKIRRVVSYILRQPGFSNGYCHMPPLTHLNSNIMRPPNHLFSKECSGFFYKHPCSCFPLFVAIQGHN